MSGCLHKTRIYQNWLLFLRAWYLFSISVIIVSLPFSKFGLSIGQFMLAGGWIMERFNFDGVTADSKERGFICTISGYIFRTVYLVFSGIVQGFIQFFNQREALVFGSILILHVAGLVFTTDFDYALKDLRTKVPLLLLPLLVSTSRSLERKTFYRLLFLFCLAVLVRTVYNAWLIWTDSYIDIRDVARNVSHIILGLQVSFAIFILTYLVLVKDCFHRLMKLVMTVMLAWYFYYLIYSQSFTGVVIVLMTVMAGVPFLIFQTRNTWLKIGLALSILIVTLLVFFSLRSVVRDYYHVNPVDFSTLDTVSARGNNYINDPYAKQTENGNYLWIYVQMEEMREVWNQRSAIPFDSLNKKNEICAFTLIRFLASKGWRKDADAVERLTAEEISAIEKGITNYKYIDNVSLRARIYEFLWGLDHYLESGNPTGSTVMQRLEFWKASVGIIEQNWLTGVGTGDMNMAFSDQYEKMGSKLAPEQRWRSHNQFLSIFVGFGIVGLIWFLLAIFYPIIKKHMVADYFVFVFIAIALFSMITEDTIESQTGVTFFALFYSLLLFARKDADLVPSEVAFMKAAAPSDVKPNHLSTNTEV